jgi:hypothetical protein
MDLKKLARPAALTVLGLHVAYGVALVAAPAPLTRRWLGDPADGDPTQVPLRGLGAREIIFHGAALAAALKGAPLRPLMLASMAGDVTDVVVSAAQRDGLPDGALKAVALAGGGSAALSGVMAAVVES